MILFSAWNFEFLVVFAVCRVVVRIICKLPVKLHRVFYIAAHRQVTSFWNRCLLSQENFLETCDSYLKCLAFDTRAILIPPNRIFSWVVFQLVVIDLKIIVGIEGDLWGGFFCVQIINHDFCSLTKSLSFPRCEYLSRSSTLGPGRSRDFWVRSSVSDFRRVFLGANLFFKKNQPLCGEKPARHSSRSLILPVAIWQTIWSFGFWRILLD